MDWMRLGNIRALEAAAYVVAKICSQNYIRETKYHKSYETWHTGCDCAGSILGNKMLHFDILKNSNVGAHSSSITSMVVVAP